MSVESRRSQESIRRTCPCSVIGWQTSVFPDKKAESFGLPVKQQTRRAESIDDGDYVTVTLHPL